MKNELSKAVLQLYELIKLGIWQDYKPNVQVFESCDWESLYELSKVQSVRGVAFDGFRRLYDAAPELGIDRKLKLRWASQAGKMLTTYKKHVAVLAKVHRTLEEAGINHIFMKGLTCSSRYPVPYLRTCGDIDFVVRPQDFSRTLEVLERISAVNHSTVHEHHGMARLAGIVLEPHYKIRNFQNAKSDAIMAAMGAEVFSHELGTARIFLEKCEETQNRDVTLHVPVFPPEFEGMFLVCHMEEHVYGEGLGLRQVIDFALWAKTCAGSEHFDAELHEHYLKDMRMLRAHRIFVRICEEYLGLPTNIFHYQYTPREKSFAGKLMRDIAKVGNFGRGEYVFHHDSKWDEIKNYWWVTRRAIRLGYLCPSEAYMWPVSKFTRYFSKALNPKKYQEIS